MYVNAEDIQTAEGRSRLVEEITADIKACKTLYKKAFDRMRQNQRLVRCGANKQWRKNSYVVNVTQRMVKQKTSYLYAKNPRMAAKKRPRLWYRLWDGNPETLAAALQAVQVAREANVEPSPDAVALLAEYDAVQRAQEMLDRIGMTMEIIFHYYMDEQIPSTKSQMKQLVRRTLTNTVGYVKLGFQRELGKRPEVQEQIADVRGQLAHIDRLAQEIAEGEEDTLGPRAEELRLSLNALQETQDIILREGLVFSYPRSTDIIPDAYCRQLRGFVGAKTVTHQMFLTPDDVTEIYGVRLEAGSYQEYQTRNGQEWQPVSARETKAPRETYVCVWESYNKPSGLMLTTLDGYKDFLEEPSAPSVQVEDFWPIYALSFGQQEDEEALFPPSDVELMQDQQMEMNRAREARRQHRIAARPGWAAASGALEDDDKDALRDRQNMSVIELKNLAPGQRIEELFQNIPMPGIDPNLYETATTFDDIQLTVGAQEATFGGVSGATATETSISEASRASVASDDVDEMNDFLSEIARAGSQILLRNTSKEEASRIAGPGAVWPELTDEEIVEELYLDVAAGSNGRPNQGMEIATTERVLPIMLQLPGFSVDWLRKHLVRLVDDTADFSEAFDPSMPSVISMNDMRQVGTGNAATEPTQQGNQGSRAAQPPQSQGGPAPGAPQVVAGTDVR